MGLSAARAPEAIRPRPVFCVIENVQASRAVADDARRGRFTHCGVTLDLGVEPDWTGAGLPSDREWRIEWTKFYWGLDLARAYGETGDIGYLEAWERLVGSWIRSEAPDTETHVVGRRIQNWIYAWDAFARSPAFPGLVDGLPGAIAGELADQVAFLSAHLTPQRNHRTLELYALFVAALALPELDTGGELLDFAMEALHANLRDDVWPDGVHRECSTHYHMLVLRSFLAARENARRFGLTFPPGYDERLGLACEFAMHAHRPDGEIPAISDSDRGSYGDLLLLAADLLGREDLRWAATQGRAGRPPSVRNVSFPWSGYHVQRSGWGDAQRAFADERYLILDAGPVGDGGHGHYDALSVEIAAGGRPLVVDPGRFTYAEDPAPNMRRWFKGTAAHNTVTVDGLDQTPYQRSKPRGRTAEARLVERVGTDGFDLLVAEVVSPVYEVVHRRRVAFVADEYWLVEDLLSGWADHRYDLRFHLAPAAAGACDLALSEGVATLTAPGLALVVGGADEVSIEAGWISPLYGVRAEAPVLVASARGAAARFLSVVVPAAEEGAAPDVRILTADGGPLVEVAGAGWRDVVSLGDGGRSVDLGPVRSTSRLAWLREGVDGGWALRLDPGGHAVGADGQPIALTRDPASWWLCARPG